MVMLADDPRDMTLRAYSGDEITSPGGRGAWDWWNGTGGGLVNQTLNSTPSTGGNQPPVVQTLPAGSATTGYSPVSLFDLFRNIQNGTQYTSSNLYDVTMPGDISVAPLSYSGGAAYSPTYLGTKNDLLNPVSGSQQVSRSLQEFLNPNSDYMRNAAQRGVEMAAARGGVNSSIAAGSSQRAALEAVQPFVQQAVDVDQQKYQLMAQDYLAQQGYAFQDQLAGKQNALQAALAQYQGGLQTSLAQYQGGLSMALAQQAANTESWLSQQNFGRALFGQTFSNSLGMLNSIQQYALDDPELYTPEVMSGYTNFFQQNMNDLLSRYFGG